MARYLVKSIVNKELRSDVVDPDNHKPEQLLPGRMRLYGYYKPALQAARYAIQAKQTITAVKGGDSSPQTIDRFNTADGSHVLQQEFEVIAPQFSLDPKLINSYYPPAGHSDEGRILPHIVFNDPHVPWYRPAGLSDWMKKAVDVHQLEKDPQPNDLGHNYMPWLGLMVFRPEELLVKDEDAGRLGLKASGMQSYDANKPPANGSFPMSVGQYLSNVKSRVYYEHGYMDADGKTTDSEFKDLLSSTEVMSAIFPTKGQLRTIFNGENNDLKPLQSQRLLAHVRHLNTIGFPDAGVEDEGLFSVILSSMTGDMTESLPSTHIVHLVSLEHLDATIKEPGSSIFGTNNSERIGLVSLFSWTYTCIPESVDFASTMLDLSQAAQPLRPPKEVLAGLQKPADSRGTLMLDEKRKQVMLQRLNAGYTIARWRTATGEETVAFNRGPLVPIPTQDIPQPATSPAANRAWPGLSMTGKDYQVFDQSIGIMDISYSSAWSLGKLMAISDSNFNAALMRLRSTIWTDASSAVRMSINGMDARVATMARATLAITSAVLFTNAKFFGPVSRINIPAPPPSIPPVDDPAITKLFRQAVDSAADHVTAAQIDGKAFVYNGFDGVGGNNSDWEIVLNWIHDVMFLATIPAHVMFPEPSHLQSFNPSPVTAGKSRLYPEALRFFHIDHAWIDAYLDGALSVANHLEPEYDYTRLRIKVIINKFLSTPIGNTGRFPPVPRYGFVLRSAAVNATPDLRLTARAWTVEKQTNGKLKTGDRDCLVRHTRLDDFTILSLVDCLPEELKYIELAQPPHQQRFALKCQLPSPAHPEIKKITPNISIKRLYTDPKQAPSTRDNPDQSLEWLPFTQTDFSDFKLPDPEQSTFYNEKTRCIEPVQIAQKVNDVLQKWGSDSRWEGKAPYDDSVPNSCILGLQLNDPAYILHIKGPNTSPPIAVFPSWVREIWAGVEPLSPVRPRSKRPTGQDIVHKFKPIPPVLGPDDISVGDPTDPARIPAPIESWTNSTPVIDRAPMKVSIIGLKPYFDSADHRFEIMVHPAYHPPPPRPIRQLRNPFKGDIYSPLDYLPTETEYLYDLIFAVRKLPPRDGQPKKVLKSLTIEILVADPKVMTANTNRPFEPLLNSTDYSNTGISMCNNQRFVATLFSGNASTIGDKDDWDGKPILGISLIPRAVSGGDNGALPLEDDGKVEELSVRLSQPRLLPVRNTTMRVPLAPLVNNQPSMELRGRSPIRLIERYRNGNSDEYQASWCLALKRSTGDTDLAGHAV